MKSDHGSFDWKSFIGDHPLFGELEADDIANLCDPEHSRHREIDRGDIVFRAGEIGNSFFLIGEGSVNVELSSEDSSSTVICTLYKGDYFGEMSAIDSQHGRAATILANEDCKLLEIKSKPFQQILRANPELEFELLSMLAARLRHVNDHLLKNTRLTYDTKFSLLSEKIESQSKVVEASLNASQAVFEQTKVRTTEIIDAAERGRTRITWVMSTLTAGFTLLLAFFGFLGYQKLDTAEQLVKDIQGVKESVVTAQTEIEASKKFVVDSKQEVIDANKEVAALSVKVRKLDADIEASNNAKRILFETLIPVFKSQLENYMETGESDPGALGLQILEANDDLITTRFFKELFFVIDNYHGYLLDNIEAMRNPDLSPEQLAELRADNDFNRAMISFCTHFMYQYIYVADDRAAGNSLAHFLSNYLLLVTYALDDSYLEDINSKKNIGLAKYPKDNFNNRLKELKIISKGDEGGRIRELDKDFLSDLRGINLTSAERKKVIDEILN